jgi:hypothetical protein
MRAPTTTDQYMQVIPEGVASTLNSISGKLRGKKAAVKRSKEATKEKAGSSRERKELQNSHQQI